MVFWRLLGSICSYELSSLLGLMEVARSSSCSMIRLSFSMWDAQVFQVIVTVQAPVRVCAKSSILSNLLHIRSMVFCRFSIDFVRPLFGVIELPVL